MNLKLIRDNVHGDIRLHPHEMRILRTAAFQRLHSCRQLGLTHLVYPAAKHSRFEHVLGVMHVADQIATHLKNNGEVDWKESDEQWRVLRLGALLHDMGHVPFGHTLEDEMPVISKHDEPASDGNSRMESSIRQVLTEAELVDYIGPVLQILTAISESKDDRKLYASVEAGKINPEYLVLADIIGNTICADLLDYIKRDHLMTGIRATFDDRIFRYFGVGEHRFNGKQYRRVVIRLIKNGRVRNDCLADLLDILKLRYNLSDKVLFHPRKCAADAMLIKGVADLHILEKDLFNYSDDGFLDAFSDSSLIKALRTSDLYKPVFSATIDGIASYDVDTREELINKLHRSASLRSRIEEKIEEAVGLPSKSVLLFVPRPQMTLKPVRVLVQWKDGTIRRLNEIKERDDLITGTQVRVLEDIYLRLWKLFLFVRADLRSYAYEVHKIFVDTLKEVANFSATCEPALFTYLGQTPEYRFGKALSDELTKNPEFARLSPNDRKRVAEISHKKLPRGKVDDRDAEPVAEPMASRNESEVNSEIVKKIINHALKQVTMKSGSRQQDLNLEKESE